MASYYASAPGAFGSVGQAYGSIAPQSYRPQVARPSVQLPPGGVGGMQVGPGSPLFPTGRTYSGALTGSLVPPAGHTNWAQTAATTPTQFDFSNDPILARIRALSEQSIHDAEADALSSRKRLAIGFGDADLAKQLGLGADVQKQASENTFGTSQELSRGLQRRNTFDITGQLSDKGNLFYSSERGRQLALSGEQYLRDKALAGSQVQEQLAAISRAVLQSKLAAQAQIIQGEQDAYNRALQYALYSAGVSG